MHDKSCSCKLHLILTLHLTAPSSALAELCIHYAFCGLRGLLYTSPLQLQISVSGTQILIVVNIMYEEGEDES